MGLGLEFKLEASYQFKISLEIRWWSRNAYSCWPYDW